MNKNSAFGHIISAGVICQNVVPLYDMLMFLMRNTKITFFKEVKIYLNTLFYAKPKLCKIYKSESSQKGEKKATTTN